MFLLGSVDAVGTFSTFRYGKVACYRKFLEKGLSLDVSYLKAIKIIGKEGSSEEGYTLKQQL